MNLFQFAVASIVDANTGYGLVQGTGKTDYAAAERRGLEIRSKSIAALIAIFRQRIGDAISAYREAARQHRELARLTRLSDHLLADIGISRSDVIAAQLGQVELTQLQSQRRDSRQRQILKLAAARRVSRQPVDSDAVNEASYAGAKCA